MSAGDPNRAAVGQGLRNVLQLRQSSGGGVHAGLLAGVAAATEAAASHQPEESTVLSLAYASASFRSGEWSDAARLYRVGFAAREVAFGRVVPSYASAAAQQQAYEDRRA